MTQPHNQNNNDWTKAIAQTIAAQEGVVLTEDHWAVVLTLRAFYLEHGVLPPMRGLIKILEGKIAAEKNTSLYLQGLFPGGLMRQGGKIAGLPKSVRCI